jgi:integrase
VGRPVRPANRDLGKKTKYIYGKTRKEVATKLTNALADKEAGMVFDAGSLTLGDYLDGWLDSIRDTLRRRTWKAYLDSP